MGVISLLGRKAVFFPGQDPYASQTLGDSQNLPCRRRHLHTILEISIEETGRRRLGFRKGWDGHDGKQDPTPYCQIVLHRPLPPP